MYGTVTTKPCTRVAKHLEMGEGIHNRFLSLTQDN